MNKNTLTRGRPTHKHTHTQTRIRVYDVEKWENQTEVVHLDEEAQTPDKVAR